MNAVVLDTSVAAAWYLTEAHAEAARAWQQRMLDGNLEMVVPSLHFIEMASALRNLVRRGHLDEALATEIDNLHRDAPLQLADPPRERILETSLQFEATAYDAVFIALAIELGIPLVTAERSTAPWVQRMGSRAITIAP